MKKGETMMDNQTKRRYKRQNFKHWWRGMNRHPYRDRKKLILKWMRFASKTVAMRGDQDQQKVVYTIYNRSFRSKYEIPRYNAKRVYDIVNAKQNKHREETAKLQAMREALLKDAPILRKTVKKRHIGSSRAGNV
jgi:hypothetical protein